MKAKLKKWFNDIKCGFREDNRNCMRYKAYGVFVSLLGVLMSFIIAFSAFCCGRNSAANKSNVVTASADSQGTPTFNNSYELRIDPIEHNTIYRGDGLFFYTNTYFIFELSADNITLESNAREYIFPYSLNSPIVEVPLYVYDMPVAASSETFDLGYYSCGIASLPTVSIEEIFSNYVLMDYQIRFDGTARQYLTFSFNFCLKTDLSVTRTIGFYMNFYPIISSNLYFYNQNRYNASNYRSYPTADYWYYYYLANYDLPDSYEIGYNEGYDEGYSLGVERGKDVGYDEGYQDGLNTAERGTFANAVSTVLGAPVTVVSQFLDFDILGFNMLAFVAGLITLMIIIKVLRIFI